LKILVLYYRQSLFSAPPVFTLMSFGPWGSSLWSQYCGCNYPEPEVMSFGILCSSLWIGFFQNPRKCLPISVDHIVQIEEGVRYYIGHTLWHNFSWPNCYFFRAFRLLSVPSYLGRGNILINAVSEGKIYNCHLSNVDRVSTFWKVMEQFCDNLRCCTNLLSGFKLQSTCPQCGQGPLLKSKELSFSSNMIQSMQKRPSTDQAEKHSCISSTPDSTAANTVEVSSIKPSTSSESPKRRRLDSALSHAVTSPRTWSIDEVAKLVEKTDLKDYVTLLRENDIDGKALLLLQRDIVISYMGLKIGPAVKLLDLIEDLKEIDARFRWLSSQIYL